MLRPTTTKRATASSDPSHDASHHASLYAMLLARDARFDGRVFVGVKTTGIYCRPVCRVRTPLARNCRFFDNAPSEGHAP